jgi:tetratricopeptide (TPR) repeat protein
LQGDYVQAEAYYKRALEIREQHLGLVHSHTASTYYHLAKLYTALEQFEEAELFSSKALSICKHAFGVNHHAFASALEQKLALLRKLKRERGL